MDYQASLTTTHPNLDIHQPNKSVSAHNGVVCIALFADWHVAMNDK